MMNRVCNKHGVPEYCPDGVCRWCEPPVRNVDRPTAPERLTTILDYAKMLGEAPALFLFYASPPVIEKVDLSPGAADDVIAATIRERFPPMLPVPGCRCDICDFVRKEINKGVNP